MSDIQDALARRVSEVIEASTSLHRADVRGTHPTAVGYYVDKRTSDASVEVFYYDPLAKDYEASQKGFIERAQPALVAAFGHSRVRSFTRRSRSGFVVAPR